MGNASEIDVGAARQSDRRSVMEARFTPEEGAPACSPTATSAPSLQVDHVPQPDALLEEDHSETLQRETIHSVSAQTKELAAVQQQMTELQSQKAAALQIEDYDLAKQCKVQIEAAAARAEALEQEINQAQALAQLSSAAAAPENQSQLEACQHELNLKTAELQDCQMNLQLKASELDQSRQELQQQLTARTEALEECRRELELMRMANIVNCTHPSSDEREQTLRAELAACREELRAKREGPDPDKGDMAVYVPTGEVVLVSSVHVDDTERYYTVRMPDGREKQTVRKRLVAVQLPAGATPIEAQQLREKFREAVAENDLLRAELHRHGRQLQPKETKVVDQLGSFFKSVGADAK